mmetsp:Transcript_91685/g.238992  ORF Transcript_91685/g.238992 Transcript_91685/m.238992 type:complete len:227 (+) Transcript_91685:1882-2562(+)
MAYAGRPWGPATGHVAPLPAVARLVPAGALRLGLPLGHTGRDLRRGVGGRWRWRGCQAFFCFLQLVLDLLNGVVLLTDQILHLGDLLPVGVGDIVSVVLPVVHLIFRCGNARLRVGEVVLGPVQLLISLLHGGLRLLPLLLVTALLQPAARLFRPPLRRLGCPPGGQDVLYQLVDLGHDLGVWRVVVGPVYLRQQRAAPRGQQRPSSALRLQARAPRARGEGRQRQ